MVEVGKEARDERRGLSAKALGKSELQISARISICGLNGNANAMVRQTLARYTFSSSHASQDHQWANNVQVKSVSEIQYSLTVHHSLAVIRLKREKPVREGRGLTVPYLRERVGSKFP